MAIDKTQELQEERLKLYEEMKSINEERSDEWSPEDQEKWDKLEKRYDEVLDEQDAEKRKLERLAKLSTLNEKIDRQSSETRSEIGQARQERSGKPTEEQKCVALQGWMRFNHGLALEKRHEDAAGLIKAQIKGGSDGGDASAPYESGWMTGPAFYARHQPHTVLGGHQMWSRGNRRLPSAYFAEKRALAVSSEPEVIPEGFMAELSQAMLDFGGFRQVARIVSTGMGNDIPWPTMDDTGNTGELLAEAGSIGASVDPTIANITLKAYKYSSKPILISAELLEDSAFNMAQVLGQALGMRIGRITATHYATGDNSAKPQGVTVFASAGVTAASATAITSDELIDLQDALDPAWEGNSGWAMRKATRKLIRQLKDTTNQYLWQPGLQAGEPDMLLGAPVAVIQEMPVATTGNVSVVYGDFTQYVIRDAGTSRFFRLDELYRANDQTGFVMFARHDGRGLQSGAIKKLTQA